MDSDIMELSKKYALTEDEFIQYYKKTLLVLKLGKSPSDEKTITVVGGQSGAGKSRLIPIAKQELDNNAVVVDFDELRALHPHYKEVCNLHTQIVHKILHSDTERVKNEVLKSLRKDGYNVIYEGALRNTQGFIDFLTDFQKDGYKIVIDIMSVPKLESFGSIFVRYATELLTDINPRWVEKEAHDASYDGVIRTVKAFIDKGLSKDIRVYIRGEEIPQKIYSSYDRQFESAIQAIIYGREFKRKKAVEDFPVKFKIVKKILEDKQPELLPNLIEWEELYNKEVEYFRNNEGIKIKD